MAYVVMVVAYLGYGPGSFCHGLYSRGPHIDHLLLRRYIYGYGYGLYTRGLRIAHGSCVETYIVMA